MLVIILEEVKWPLLRGLTYNKLHLFLVRRSLSFDKCMSTEKEKYSLKVEDYVLFGRLPGKSHGRRTLVGCSPWGRTELDTTEAT